MWKLDEQPREPTLTPRGGRASSIADLVLGIATLAAAITVVALATGLGSLLGIALFIWLGRIAIRLWHSPSRLSKVLAACLVPALFWSHLMSKGTRQRIKDFEAANAQRAQRL